MSIASSYWCTPLQHRSTPIYDQGLPSPPFRTPRSKIDPHFSRAMLPQVRITETKLGLIALLIYWDHSIRLYRGLDYWCKRICGSCHRRVVRHPLVRSAGAPGYGDCSCELIELWKKVFRSLKRPVDIPDPGKLGAVVKGHCFADSKSCQSIFPRLKAC